MMQGVDLARFVRAIGIDNARIRQEETKKNRKNERVAAIGNFLQAPLGLERADPGICKINHKLEGAVSGLERTKSAIELRKEDAS